MSSSSHLRQSLGLRLVIVVVISNIVGSGIYKKVAPMSAELHSSGWILICWILSGLITLFGALSNAEVAGLLAGTGGEYVYYKKIYNRFFAFLFGWSLFTVIQTAAISSLAYVFAQSLHSIIPLPALLPHLADYNIGGVFYPFIDLNIKITAIFLIIILTWLNTKGIKMGTRVSTAILFLVLSGIAMIVLAGISSEQANFSRIVNLTPVNAAPVTISAFFPRCYPLFGLIRAGQQ